MNLNRLRNALSLSAAGEHQDFPADCQLLDVQSSPGLKFKHMPDGLDVNAVRFGEMVGTHFPQDPYDSLESRTAPRFRTCESVLLLNLFQDASFARVHSMFEDKLHKVVVLENNFDKIGHPARMNCLLRRLTLVVVMPQKEEISLNETCSVMGLTQLQS